MRKRKTRTRVWDRSIVLMLAAVLAAAGLTASSSALAGGAPKASGRTPLSPRRSGSRPTAVPPGPTTAIATTGTRSTRREPIGGTTAVCATTARAGRPRSQVRSRHRPPRRRLPPRSPARPPRRSRSPPRPRRSPTPTPTPTPQPTPPGKTLSRRQLRQHLRGSGGRVRRSVEGSADLLPAARRRGLLAQRVGQGSHGRRDHDVRDLVEGDRPERDSHVPGRHPQQPHGLHLVQPRAGERHRLARVRGCTTHGLPSTGGSGVCSRR